MGNQDQSNKLFDRIYKLINGIDLRVSRQSLIKILPLICCCFLIVMPADSSEGPVMNPRKEGPINIQNLPQVYSKSSPLSTSQESTPLGIAKVIAIYEDSTTALIKIISPSDDFPIRFLITLSDSTGIPHTREYIRVE